MYGSPRIVGFTGGSTAVVAIPLTTGGRCHTDLNS